MNNLHKLTYSALLYRSSNKSGSVRKVLVNPYVCSSKLYRILFIVRSILYASAKSNSLSSLIVNNTNFMSRSHCNIKNIMSKIRNVFTTYTERMSFVFESNFLQVLHKTLQLFYLIIGL